MLMLRMRAFNVRAEAQLLAWRVEGALLIRRIFFPDLRLGNSSGDAGVTYEVKSTWERLSWNNRLGDISCRWGRRNPAVSNWRISLRERFVPILTGQVSGTSGLDITHFLRVLLTHLSISSLQKKNCKSSCLFFRKLVIISVYVGAAVLFPSWTIRATHFFFVIACIGKQAFADVFGTRAMCQLLSSQADSWTVVTCCKGASGVTSLTRVLPFNCYGAIGVANV